MLSFFHYRRSKHRSWWISNCWCYDDIVTRPKRTTIPLVPKEAKGRMRLNPYVISVHVVMIPLLAKIWIMTTRSSSARNIPSWLLVARVRRSTKAHKVPARPKTSSRSTGTDTIVVVVVDTTSSREKRERKALRKSPHWTKEWHLFRAEKCFLSSRFKRMTGTSEEFVSGKKRRALSYGIITNRDAHDTRKVQ